MSCTYCDQVELATPTAEDVAAALHRYHQLQEEHRAAVRAMLEVGERYSAATTEYLHLHYRHGDLREQLLHDIVDVRARGGWTAAKLARHLHRRLEEITPVLDSLTNGEPARHHNGSSYVIHRDGRRYEAMPYSGGAS